MGRDREHVAGLAVGRDQRPEVQRREHVAVEHQERPVEVRDRRQRPAVPSAAVLGRGSGSTCRSTVRRPRTARIRWARWPTASVTSSNPASRKLPQDDLQDRAVADRHERLGQHRRVGRQPRAAPAGEHDGAPRHDVPLAFAGLAAHPVARRYGRGDGEHPARHPRRLRASPLAGLAGAAALGAAARRRCWRAIRRTGLVAPLAAVLRRAWRLALAAARYELDDRRSASCCSAWCGSSPRPRMRCWPRSIGARDRDRPASTCGACPARCSRCSSSCSR